MGDLATASQPAVGMVLLHLSSERVRQVLIHLSAVNPNCNCQFTCRLARASRQLLLQLLNQRVSHGVARSAHDW